MNRLFAQFVLCALLSIATMPISGIASPHPDTSDTHKEPFTFADFSWLNGNDRRSHSLLDSKYFTGSFLFDANYTYSNQHPNDNTVVGSTALARNNELGISFVGLGGDLHVEHARGRIMLQFGTRSTVVPRNDGSVIRGQHDLITAYRYFSEAYAGYHWDTWNGINLDAGLFMSYIGLFSFYNMENWAYQPSFTSDNTPWFFNGLRLQVFPTDRLKIEVWVVNGWQSYAKYNSLPGLGAEVLWRPTGSFSFVSNEYIGTDAAHHPKRFRFHSDNSVQLKYYDHPDRFVHRAAFSMTADLGAEQGDGVSAFGDESQPKQQFFSAMAYHRLWFDHNQFGWTIGGGFMHNPGRYLVLLPTGAAGSSFSTDPGTTFDAWDVSTTMDYMPDELQTWRIEVVHREASVPYFAGPGGVTSPDGYSSTPLPASWKPDQVKSETRLILALMVRF